MIDEAPRAKRRASRSACSAMPPRCSPRSVRRGVRPDMVTDQTSAHDPLHGYLPVGWDVGQLGGAPATATRTASSAAAKESMAAHVRAMLDFHRAGVPTLDYGNNIRQFAKEMGVADAFDFPGFVPAYIRPLFCTRRRAVPLGRAFRRPRGHLARPTPRSRSCSRDDRHLHRWLDMARERIAFQGLPARICWLGLGRAGRRASPSTRWWPAASSRRRS